MDSQSPFQGLDLIQWNGITESRIQDCQRTPNLRGYQWLVTSRKAYTWSQSLVSPSCWWHLVQNTSSKQQSRKKHKNNHQLTELPQTLQIIPLHKTLSIRGKTKNKNSPLPPRMQAQVTPNKKSTQTTKPTLPTKGKNQKEEGIWC